MKIILYKYLTLILLAFPIVLLGNDTELKGKHNKEKTIKKEYNVNSDALLKITNSYGNLNITSWNEDKIIIEVHIKTNGDSEEKVQRKLDDITIEFEASSSIVSAKTIFNKTKNSWGWNWGNNNNVNMQINYTIKLPIKNNVNLTNDYGNIILDRIDGHAKISCDYGRLEIGELRGRNNQLRFDYTSKSSIGYIKSGEIRADYSGFTIEKAGDLMINSDYTSANIIAMENLQYKGDYGNLEVGEVNNVQGNGSYINVNLGTVHGNTNITADYGSIRIKEMAEDAGNLEIRTDYTGIKLGYAPGYHFDFEINTDYASVKGKEDFEINVSDVKSTKKYYKGYHGSANSGNTLYISSEYGGISFSKNESVSKN